MRTRFQQGFTLVEMLTVIAIMAFLAALLLPVLWRGKEAGRMAKCTSNLRNFGQAIDICRGQRDDFPPFLSNLSPHFIDHEEIYICPSDRSVPKGSEGGKPPHEPYNLQFAETDDNLNNDYSQRNEEIEYCSYLYEFANVPCSWAPGYTWKEKKIEEMELGAELGPGRPGGRGSARTIAVYGKVPIVRCFWHLKPEGTGYVDQALVLNLAVEDKNVFRSGPNADDWKIETNY